MPVKQMMIYLTVEKSDIDEYGRHYKYQQLLDIDLVRDDVAEFLAKIPEDVNDHSSIWVTIRRADNEIVAYADGLSTDPFRKKGPKVWKRASEIKSYRIHIEDGHIVRKIREIGRNIADNMRDTAKIFSDRRYQRTKKQADEENGS